MRVNLAILLGKICRLISRTMGKNGSNLPGLVSLKVDVDILRKLAQKVKKIFIITGTNGKTTTSNVLTQIFKDSGKKVFSNHEGSNMITGVTSAFVNNANIFGNLKYEFAVLEVDEASLPKVVNQLDPDSIIITNFFRDQLDRYGEIDTLIDNLGEAIKKINPKLYLNSDDPFAYKFSDLGKKNIFYGLGKEAYSFIQYQHSESKLCPRCSSSLEYEYITYGQLGHFKCPCGFTRTKPHFELNKVYKNENLMFKVNQQNYTTNLSGSYNLYNLLAAIALAKENEITDEQIKQALINYYPNNGRMENFHINGCNCILNLVKNPTGMNMSLSQIKIDNIPKLIIFVLNDLAIDGRDVSWIWDADFEILLKDRSIVKYICSGLRGYDMALRLKYAGINENNILVFEKVSEAIDYSLEYKTDIYIFPNYSALENVHNYLQKGLSNICN